MGRSVGLNSVGILGDGAHDSSVMVQHAETVCPGCRLLLPGVDMPAHLYMTCSSACWARYGDLLAVQYASPQRMAFHQLVVDSYAVQHPGGDDRRAIQSVGIHLMTLCLLSSGEPIPHWERACTVAWSTDRCSTSSARRRHAGSSRCSTSLSMAIRRMRASRRMRGQRMSGWPGCRTTKRFEGGSTGRVSARHSDARGSACGHWPLKVSSSHPLLGSGIVSR
jgi:Family of unknown function (DUF5946)